mgnify:CR=1 FL=1
MITTALDGAIKKFLETIENDYQDWSMENDNMAYKYLSFKKSGQCITTTAHQGSDCPGARSV